MTPTTDPTKLADEIEAAWLELCERDDRTSPEEYPEMCLIEHGELAEFMQRAALRRPTPPPDVAKLREAAWALLVRVENFKNAALRASGTSEYCELRTLLGFETGNTVAPNTVGPGRRT